MNKFFGVFFAAMALFVGFQARAEAAGENILVAYFSYSGNTAAVAREISDRTGGTLFEIRPVTPYPAYDECLDVAKAEKNDDARPAIADQIGNMAAYDVIFIGYPIWWYDAPMIVRTFLESYDFAGKAVIPFATSGGSPLEGSLDSVRASAAGASLREGLLANDSGAVAPWLQALGY